MREGGRGELLVGEGEENGKKTPAIVIWKIFLFLFVIILFLFVSSAIVCGTDDGCRSNIPTIQNMLTSNLSVPFVISGLNVVLGIHLLISTFLFFTTNIKAPHFSALQVLSAVFSYVSCIVALFVLPFTGWANDWVNVSTIVILAFWMCFAQVSLKRNLYSIRWFSLMTIIYICCIIPYIVVRAVPDIPIYGKDVGLLVIEIVGGLSFVLFMILCIRHIYKMEIRFDTHNLGFD